MKRTPTRIVAFGAIAGLLALSACGSDDATPAEEAASVVSEAAAEQDAVTSEVAAEVGDIVETAINAGSFGTSSQPSRQLTWSTRSRAPDRSR